VIQIRKVIGLSYGYTTITPEKTDTHIPVESDAGYRERMWMEQSEVMGDAVKTVTEFLCSAQNTSETLRQEAVDYIKAKARLAAEYDYKIKWNPGDIEAGEVEAEAVGAEIGIKSEVCVSVALQRAGYKIVGRTAEEDLHSGVDLYAIPPGHEEMGQILVIQIKAIARLENVVVEDVANHRISGELPEIDQKRVEDIDRSVRAMSRYLASKTDGPSNVHPEFDQDHLAVPLVFYIPSGKYPAYKGTGEPREYFAPQLQEAIRKATFKPKKSRSG